MTLTLQERFYRYFLFAAHIAFALTIFLTPFRWRLVLWQRPFFPVYSDYTDYLLFASDLSMLCVLLFWACSLLAKPRKLKPGPSLMWTSLIGLTIAGWVSISGSVDGILSHYHAVRFVGLLLFYLFIVNEIKFNGWVIVPVGAQILLQSVVVILQVTAQRSLGLQKFGELSLDPSVAGISVIFGDGFRFLRGYGLSDHPNILGGCIAFGLILLLAVVLYGNHPDSSSAYTCTALRLVQCRCPLQSPLSMYPLLASAVFLVGFPALIMTFSRSAWLSFFVAGSFMVGREALARRWDSVKRAILLGMLSLLIAAPFILKNISLFQSRVNSGDMAQDDPMQERAFLMEAGNTLFVEHSAIGVGLGATPLAMKERFVDFPLNFQPPHYTILTAAIETGVLGGIFYLLLMAVPFVTLLLRWEVVSQRPAMMGVFALLLAITVVGFFDYYTWSYSSGRVWQWLGWGLYSAVSETA